MIKYNIRIFAFTILGLAFTTYIIIFLSTQNLDSINFQKALSHISTTITINIIIWTIFINWAWKWKVFYPWLVPFPNLSGEWDGTLKSNWKEKSLAPIPTEIKITQTFFNVQVRIKTNESTSYSTAASFDIDKDRGLQQLFYSYLNTPKSGVRERSEIHYGTTLLNFEGFNVTNIEGEYWTSRETTGEIKLNKKTLKNKFTKWFLIIFCSILIGLYFGLGTIFGFFYLFGILGISTIVILILLAIWKKTDKKLIFSKRVFLTLIIGLIFSFITVKTKNYVNKEIAESLISDINSYQLKNGTLPKSLSDLIPNQTARIPLYFDTYQLKEFEYWPTENGNFSLNYYLDGWHNNKYKSETKNWKSSD